MDRVSACTLFSLILVGSVAQAQRDELPTPTVGTPIDIRASDVLPREQLRGSNYTVRDTLTVLNGRLQFVIETRWGDLPADGLNMVQLRISEMASLERATELARDPQLINGLLSNVGSATRGIGSLLRDPVGAVVRTPQGLERLIKNRIDEENQRAGGETRRKLAREISCDPETTNPYLKRMLDRLSQEKEIGSIAGKVGLSIAVPGLGLLPATTEFRDTLQLRAPNEINEVVRVELSRLKVSKDTIESLIRADHWTTFRRLLMVRFLEQMDGVENRYLLVNLAANARTEAETLDALQIITLLSKLHQKNKVSGIARAAIPLALMNDGSRVWVLSADYITDSPALVSGLALLEDESRSTKKQVLTPAILTPSARQRINAADVSLIE